MRHEERILHKAGYGVPVMLQARKGPVKKTLFLWTLSSGIVKGVRHAGAGLRETGVSSLG